MKKLLPLCALLILIAMPASADEWVWGMLPTTPTYDVRWQQMDELWQDHWDGKNLNTIVKLAQELETAYPDKPEPKIWLSRTYFAKASHSRINRYENFATAEEYAEKALNTDPQNIYAFKNLMAAAAYAGGRDYVLGKYGRWIKTLAPLPSGYVLPVFDSYPEWPAFKQLYDGRHNNINSGLQALTLIEALAGKHQDDYLIQSWASRVNYDLGNYYYYRQDPASMNHYQRARDFGEKAVKLNENYPPSRYWYILSVARCIEFKPLAVKAQYVMPMTKHNLFCGTENPLYNYFGPGLALATMITKGGWATEKGMQIIGVNLEQAINMLEIAEIIYPTKFYVYYGHADVLNYQGRNDEALAVIRKVTGLDPTADPYLTLENQGVLLAIKSLSAQQK